jgi:hypothetical protein
LIHEQFLESPLLDITSLVFLEVVDILDGPSENGTLGLFASAVRDYSSKLVDAVVDVPSATAFNFFLKDCKNKAQKR